jgi:tripartite-type tricarboxylate transporter receptor subunit TctC
MHCRAWRRSARRAFPISKQASGTAFSPRPERPPEVVSQLNGEIDRALKSPEMRRHFAMLSLESVGGSVSDFDRFFRSEIARWTRVARENGLTFEQEH